MSAFRLSRLLPVTLLVWAVAAAPAVRAGDIDKYLPEDSEIVVTVNVRLLLDSPVVKMNGLDQAKQALKAIDEVNDVLKDLGFDPFADLDTVTAAGPGGGDRDRGLVIVHGKFDLDKFKAKAEEVAKGMPDVLKVHKVNDGQGGHFLLYEVQMPEQNVSFFVSLPNKGTLLVGPGKDYVVDALKREFAKEKPALKNKGFQALLEQLDPKQHVSIAFVGSAAASIEGLPDPVKNALNAVDALGGGLTFGDDIKIEFVAATKTAKEAQDLDQTVNQALVLGQLLLPQLAKEHPEIKPALDVLKTVRCSSKGKTVKVKAEISAEVIEALMKNK